MNKPRFSDMQILAILREAANGAQAAVLCRKYHISDTTFYNWRRKFGAAVPPASPDQLSRENRLLRQRLSAQERELASIRQRPGSR